VSLASCLKEFREERNWTQGELHRRTGLERSYLSRLESGKVQDLSLKNAMLICQAFGITVEQFAERCFKQQDDADAGPSPG